MGEQVIDPDYLDMDMPAASSERRERLTMGCRFDELQSRPWPKGICTCTIAAGLLLATQINAAADARFVSPDMRFEAYTRSSATDGTGSKLFLRRARTRAKGILLFENMRWLEAKWSPDSRFLAVVDHNDGHIADVYVFRVSAADAAQPQIALHCHTPNPGSYDVRWDVVGWRSGPREILLTKEVRDQSARRTTRKRIVARIGDSPISKPPQ